MREDGIVWRSGARPGDGHQGRYRTTPPTPVTVMVPLRLVDKLKPRAAERGYSLAKHCAELVELGWAATVGAIEAPVLAPQPEPVSIEPRPTSLAPYGGPVPGRLASATSIAFLVALPAIAEPERAGEEPAIAPALVRTVRALRAAGQTPREIAASTGLARDDVLEILGRRG